jgi:DNA-binding response OmpR family regulator
MRKPNILVIENGSRSVHQLELFLTDAGYQISYAENEWEINSFFQVRDLILFCLI